MGKAHRVLIIGLGRIGMGYDFDKDDTHVLSHARAFQRHQAFQLIGGVDVDSEKRTQFEGRFGCPAFQNIESGMRELNPDVVVIATPTAGHAVTVQQVFAAGNPLAILCEKPLALSMREGKDIVEMCRSRQCALFANYMRRSDMTVHHIRQRLDSGEIQTPIKGILWYSKGLYNSASHFVNLAQYLLGDVTNVCVTAKGARHDGRDPEPDFHITFTRGEIYFLAANAGSLFHNAMEWITPNGRLRYERGGAVSYWEAASSDAVYSGYTVIGSHGEYLPSDFQRVQWHVADQLALSLAGGNARICNGDDALRTIEVIARVEELS